MARKISSVNIDMSSLIDELGSIFHSSPNKYGLNSILSCGTSRTRRRKILTLEQVEDDSETFINLFGSFVGVNSGDIALGFFPNPNLYYRIGNLRDMLNRELFSGDHKLSDEDYKFILEGLKLYPEYIAKYVVMNIDDFLDFKVGTEKSSLILNLIELNKHRESINEDIKRVKDKSNVTWVLDIANSLSNITDNAESVARSYFGAFLSEDSHRNKYDGSISAIRTSKNPNIESLILKYMELGIPLEFLIALKSYGFAINQRKNLRDIFKKSSKDAKVSVAKKLSSMSYVIAPSDVVNSESFDVVFNILDIMRALEWDENVIFSNDIAVQYKNSTLLKGVLKKFDVNTVFSYNNLNMKDYNLEDIISKYDTVCSILIDCGSLYTRKVTKSQYSMLAFSPIMIMNSGRVFHQAAQMVLKKF